MLLQLKQAMQEAQSNKAPMLCRNPQQIPAEIVRAGQVVSRKKAEKAPFQVGRHILTYNSPIPKIEMIEK